MNTPKQSRKNQSMTDTIEVPIELIKNGNIAALRELLPKQESLFGRWATHSKYGRGIIVSAHPAQIGAIRFVREKENSNDGADGQWVIFNDIIIDPVELTAKKEFEKAPEGTVIEESSWGMYYKTYTNHWENQKDTLTDEELAKVGPWDVIRWGKSK